MTEERIDIELTDKVSPQIAPKIRQIATASREAFNALEELKRQLATLDTSAVDRLAASAARVTNAQARQVTASARLTAANAKMETASAKAAVTQQRLATETARTSAATARASAEATKAATATTQQAIAETRLAAAKSREAAATNAANAAQSASNRLRQQGNRVSRQSQQQVQNLVYQLNDIVVGLASGQKPMTVLLQQGSQISTIFGPGRGVLGTLRALGGALATILVPLLPLVAVVGTIAAGVGLLTKSIRESTGVSVSFGDTFKAIFQVAGRAIYDLLLPAIDAVSPAFTKAYEIIVAVTKTTINAVVGSFVFAYNAIAKTFGLLPAAMKDIFSITVNAVLKAVEFMVNGVLAGLNKVISLANAASEKLGQGKLFDDIADVDLSRFKLEVTGAAQEVGKIISDEASKAFSTDFAGKAFDAIAKQAVENNKKRLAEEQKNAGGTKALKEELSASEKLYQDIKKPMLEYIETLAAANELLKAGRISIEEYNTALNKTQLKTDVLAVDKSLPEFQQGAELEELNTQQQERIAIIQQAMQARILTEQEGADRIRAINQQLALDVMNIEAARNSMILTGASETFDQLAQAAAGFAGEQSALYQALFVASKAFAIADSIIKIQQGIANALALPFPANLAAVASVAAAAANIVSSIQAVQFSAQGKKDGGFIAGPGGPRDDKVPIWASNGEFVVNAAATRRNRPLLEAINDNRPRPYRDGGLVGKPRDVQNPTARVGGKMVNAQAGRGSVTVNVYAQDAQSFMASRNQVAAAMARTVNEGYRNL